MIRQKVPGENEPNKWLKFIGQTLSPSHYRNRHKKQERVSSLKKSFVLAQSRENDESIWTSHLTIPVDKKCQILTITITILPTNYYFQLLGNTWRVSGTFAQGIFK